MPTSLYIAEGTPSHLTLVTAAAETERANSFDWRHYFRNAIVFSLVVPGIYFILDGIGSAAIQIFCVCRFGELDNSTTRQGFARFGLDGLNGFATPAGPFAKFVLDVPRMVGMPTIGIIYLICLFVMLRAFSRHVGKWT
jgi:hypothetical protein